MIWIIATALVLILIGAYARAVAATPPEPFTTIEDEPDAPHKDDRWGGDW